MGEDIHVHQSTCQTSHFLEALYAVNATLSHTVFNALSDLLGISVEVNQICISHHQQEERQSQDRLQT